MTPAPKPCTTPGCPNTRTPGRTRCHDCDHAADQQRGTAATRGYTTPGHRRFRRLVLRRDPHCVLCGAPATVADHWPTSRRDLITQGLNPNDPAHGRGLCASCHSRETIRNQPGGWTTT